MAHSFTVPAVRLSITAMLGRIERRNGNPRPAAGGGRGGRPATATSHAWLKTLN